MPQAKTRRATTFGKNHDAKRWRKGIKLPPHQFTKQPVPCIIIMVNIAARDVWKETMSILSRERKTRINQPRDPRPVEDARMNIMQRRNIVKSN